MDAFSKGNIDLSWLETYVFYYEAYRKATIDKDNFEVLERYLKLINELTKVGYLGKFRMGTSMFRLILSRSMKHHLRPDQRMIRLEVRKEMIRLTHNLQEVDIRESVEVVNFEDLNSYLDGLLKFPFD